MSSAIRGDAASPTHAAQARPATITPAAGLNDMCLAEAVHGTAPDLVGKDLANPTAILLSSAMMLRHLGRVADADRIQAAVLATIAQGARRAWRLERMRKGLGGRGPEFHRRVAVPGSGAPRRATIPPTHPGGESGSQH